MYQQKVTNHQMFDEVCTHISLFSTLIHIHEWENRSLFTASCAFASNAGNDLHCTWFFGFFKNQVYYIQNCSPCNFVCIFSEFWTSLFLHNHTFHIQRRADTDQLVIVILNITTVSIRQDGWQMDSSCIYICTTLISTCNSRAANCGFDIDSSGGTT